MDYHEFSGLKQGKLIITLFCRSLTGQNHEASTAVFISEGSRGKPVSCSFGLLAEFSSELYSIGYRLRSLGFLLLLLAVRWRLPLESRVSLQFFTENQQLGTESFLSHYFIPCSTVKSLFLTTLGTAFCF